MAKKSQPGGPSDLQSGPTCKGAVDVSLQIEPGAIFGLVGRNGPGKTTLIKILAGLLRPDSGSGQVKKQCQFRDHVEQ